jgi:hypothetical protein
VFLLCSSVPKWQFSPISSTFSGHSLYTLTLTKTLTKDLLGTNHANHTNKGGDLKLPSFRKGGVARRAGWYQYSCHWLSPPPLSEDCSMKTQSPPRRRGVDYPQTSQAPTYPPQKKASPLTPHFFPYKEIREIRAKNRIGGRGKSELAERQGIDIF